MSASIVDRLRADGRLPEALELLLGLPIDAKRTTAVRCLRPALHRNGDAHPSMIVEPTAGGASCAVCSLSLGLLDVGVETKFGADRADVARRLEERLYAAPAATNGHAPRTTSATWPDVPQEDVEALGWTLTTERGRPAIRATIYGADLRPCGIKVRGPRNADGKLLAYIEPAEDGRREPGIVGDADRLADLGPGALVLLLAGETDLLSLLAAARREGVVLPPVLSPSNGEGQPLGPVAEAFRGLRVGIIYDVDGPGRKGAADRLAELRGVAERVVDVRIPFSVEDRTAGLKDLRDHLDHGGSAHGVLDLVHAALEAPDVQEVVGATDPAPALRYTAAELFAADLPPRRELVRDLLAERDLVVIGGAASAGKTWIVLSLLVRLAAGCGEWLDRPVVAGSPVPVLLVCGEDTPRRIRDRLAAVAGGLGVDAASLSFSVAWPTGSAANLASPSGLAWLARMIEKTGARVVALDNVTSLVLADVKDDQASTEFIRSLHALRDRFGVTFFLAAHVRKGSADAARTSSSYVDALFGSHVWRSLPDVVLMIEREDGPRRWTIVRHAKARDVEALRDRLFEFVAEDGHHEFRADLGVSPVGPDGVSPKRAKVDLARLREALSPVGTWRTRESVREDLGVSDSTVREALRRLRPHLGDELEERDAPGPHGARELRLVPLEERVRRGPAGGAA